MEQLNDNKQILGRPILHDKVAITIQDRSVELRFRESVFNLSLDKRGMPQFPESVKQQLPTYMPQVVRLKLRMFRIEGVRNGDHIEHAGWCAESRGIGTCDCYPGLQVGGGFPDTLTCGLCNASSTGDYVCSLETYGDGTNGPNGSDIAELWETAWTDPEEKLYYHCPEGICNHRIGDQTRSIP
jgi:hypothetical protein